MSFTAIQSADIPALIDCIYPDSASTSTFMPECASKEAAQEQLRTYVGTSLQGCAWTITLLNTVAPIGIIILSPEMVDAQQVQAIWFTHSTNSGDTALHYAICGKYQQNRYAIEAAMRVVAYAFDDLKLSRLVTIIDSTNPLSIKVQERIGASILDNTAPYLKMQSKSQKVCIILPPPQSVSV